MKTANKINTRVELLTHLIALKRSALERYEAAQTDVEQINAALDAFARAERSRVWENHLRNGKPSSGTTPVEGEN